MTGRTLGDGTAHERQVLEVNLERVEFVPDRVQLVPHDHFTLVLDAVDRDPDYLDLDLWAACLVGWAQVLTRYQLK